MKEKYPDFKYDDTQNTYYYYINGQIISMSYLVTDLHEKIVSISIQEEGN